jgi:hypothetical protein
VQRNATQRSAKKYRSIPSPFPFALFFGLSPSNQSHLGVHCKIFFCVYINKQTNKPVHIHMHSWTTLVAAAAHTVTHTRERIHGRRSQQMEPTQQQMWGWFVGVPQRHRQVQDSLCSGLVLVYQQGHFRQTNRPAGGPESREVRSGSIRASRPPATTGQAFFFVSGFLGSSVPYYHTIH